MSAKSPSEFAGIDNNKKNKKSMNTNYTNLKRVLKTIRQNQFRMV